MIHGLKKKKKEYLERVREIENGEYSKYKELQYIRLLNRCQAMSKKIKNARLAKKGKGKK